MFQRLQEPGSSRRQPRYLVEEDDVTLGGIERFQEGSQLTERGIPTKPSSQAARIPNAMQDIATGQNYKWPYLSLQRVFWPLISRLAALGSRPDFPNRLRHVGLQRPPKPDALQGFAWTRLNVSPVSPGGPPAMTNWN